MGLTPRHPMHHPPLRLINSVEQTRTRPSHGKVLASLSYESLGVCFLVRRQTPVGHVRAHVTRESHQPASHQCGYGNWWRTAAIPDSTRMTQVSLYIALNNFVPLHCATWLLVPQTDQIHLPHNRWGRQIAEWIGSRGEIQKHSFDPRELPSRTWPRPEPLSRLIAR